MSSVAKLFTLPKDRSREENELALADAASIRQEAALEQEAILEDANASAEAAVFNANILKRNAVLAIDNARINEARTRKNSRRLQAEQKVAIGGSGFTKTGFEDLIADSASEDELDALLIRREGKLQAEGLFTQAALSLKGGADALEAGSRGVRSSSTVSSSRQSAAILQGQNRARASREARRNATIDAAFSIAEDAISPTSSMIRLRKVMN